MWEDSLIESRGSSANQKKWRQWPVSLGFHGGIIAAIAVVSYVNLVPLKPVEPPSPLIFRTFVVPSAPPALGTRTAKPSAKPSPTVAVSPTPVVVPETVADTANDSLSNVAYDTDSTISDGSSPGVAWGVSGGDPNSDQGVDGGLPAASDAPKIITPDMQPPVLLKKVELPYPKAALLLKIQGIVILQAVINRSGLIEELTLQRSAHPLLDEAAMQAVKQWIYRPATLDGRPVKVYFTVTVNFQFSIKTKVLPWAPIAQSDFRPDR
jgi:periplasmic protein TonB